MKSKDFVWKTLLDEVEPLEKPLHNIPCNSRCNFARKRYGLSDDELEYARKRFKERYHNDPEFRRRILDRQKKRGVNKNERD